MWRAAAVWLLVAALVASGAVAQSDRSPLEILSVLSHLRPAKTVVRAVKEAAPELFMDLATRLRGWGYPLEAHTVRTEDGFELTAHRIPHGRTRSAGADFDSNALHAEPEPPDANADADADADTDARPPVILQHGMLSCSEYFAIAGPDLAPALRLADAGYDVWMTNVRGNDYSKKHETLKSSDRRFWKFSFHEMGLYDIPAFIDYILNVTKQEKLFYIGHSLGSTAFFVAMSMRPEYNSKIRLQMSLAPSVFFDDMVSAPLRVAVANAEYFKAIFQAMPTYELLTRSDSAIAVVYLLCNDEASFNKICPLLLSFLVGPIDLNDTRNTSLVLSRTGSSTSSQVLLHFGQVIQSEKFRAMDHGPSENKKLYGNTVPPKYPLEKVTAPVALYVAEGDAIVSKKAAEHLAMLLPNVISLLYIRDEFFNHFSFANHPRLNELVVDNLLEMMSLF